MILNYTLGYSKNIGSRADLVVVYEKVRFLDTHDSLRLFLEVKLQKYLLIEKRQRYQPRSIAIWAHQTMQDWSQVQTHGQDSQHHAAQGLGPQAFVEWKHVPHARRDSGVLIETHLFNC